MTRIARRPDRPFLRDATLLLGSSLTVMAGAAIAPALPSIAAAFPDDPSAERLAKLALTLPGLFIAFAAPFSGWLLDRFGRRNVLIASVAAYALAGTSGLYLPSLHAILVGRALLGLAVAGTMTSCVTLIGDYHAGAARERFMGIQAAFMGLGGMVFLSSSGLLADVHWRAPFLVYAMSLAVLPGALFFVREPKRHVHELILGDSSAAAIAPPPPRADHGAPVALAALLFAVAFGAMVAFYMVPVHLPFHVRTLAAAQAAASATTANRDATEARAATGEVEAMPVVESMGAREPFRKVEPVDGSKRRDGARAGFAIAALTLVSACASLGYQKLRGRLSHPAVFAASFLLHGAGYMAVGQAESYGAMVAGMLVAGLGTGLMMPNLNVWLLGRTPERLRGRVVGGMTCCFFLGQFASPLLTDPLVRATGTATAFGWAGAAIMAAGASFGLYAMWIAARGRRASAALV